jgi:hypothetical protein
MPVDHELGHVEPFASIADFLSELGLLGQFIPCCFPSADDGAGPGLLFEEQRGAVRAAVSFDADGCDFIVSGSEPRCEHLSGSDAAHALAHWRRAFPTSGREADR